MHGRIVSWIVLWVASMLVACGATKTKAPAEVTAGGVADGRGDDSTAGDSAVRPHDVHDDVVSVDVANLDSVQQDVCVPDCNDKECGDNGCGGPCPCGEGLVCVETQCVEPNCGTVWCSAWETCHEGKCYSADPCHSIECGDGSFGVECGTCGTGDTCSAGGQCHEPVVSPLDEAATGVLLVEGFALGSHCSSAYSLDIDMNEQTSSPSELYANCEPGLDNQFLDLNHHCFAWVYPDILPRGSVFLDHFLPGFSNDYRTYNWILQLQSEEAGEGPNALHVYRGSLDSGDSCPTGSQECFHLLPTGHAPDDLGLGVIYDVTIENGHMSGGGPGSTLHLDGLAEHWLPVNTYAKALYKVCLQSREQPEDADHCGECVLKHFSSSTSLTLYNARVEGDAVLQDGKLVTFKGVVGGAIRPVEFHDAELAVLDVLKEIMLYKHPISGPGCEDQVLDMMNSMNSCANKLGATVDIDTDDDGVPDAISIGFRIEATAASLSGLQLSGGGNE